MEDKHYDLNLFEVDVSLRMLITASNSKHAIQRVEELFKGRITQYVHPDDTPPKFKVIAVVRETRFLDVPKRKTIIHEGSTQRSSLHTKAESKESPLQLDDSVPM
jgi:hypothetical protein